jgi:protein involved in polysaccharide export with SLBB domain
MSVAMKRSVFLFTLLLAVPVFTVAQSQTGERRSNKSEPLTTGSTAVRQRVVGPPKANHAEGQKTVDETRNNPTSASRKDPKATTPATGQNSSQPKWGNTAVVVRSAPNERMVPLESTKTDQPAVPDEKINKPATKLVQRTALLTKAPMAAQMAVPLSRASSPSTLVSPEPAPTVGYHVGVGDVLDIRLANLPTRESTLFTVLRNGVLEYPLLSGPLSVAGMTTDEIAKLLVNEIKVLNNPLVSVSVRDYASHSVVVTGLVDLPGTRNMRREAMPLFAVLSESLPRPEAQLVTITRQGRDQTISLSDEKGMSTLVLPNDHLTVTGGSRTVKRFVYVGGDVGARGEKEFREGMTLTQALLSAGGVTHSSKITVKVARRNSNGFLISSEYNFQSIEEGKSQDPLLEAGDRIEVTRGM